MNKIVASASEAIADMSEGCSVAIAGFGLAHRFPNSLLRALRDKGTKNLTVVCNSPGGSGEKGQVLIENRQVSKLIASFSIRPGMVTAAQDLIDKGEMEVELVPQGTLVERCRAGGAGIPAFFIATGADTALAEGKEIRHFNGRAHVLEQAIQVDFAFLSASRADKAGNVQFKGSSSNLNPSFAKAARVAIVEADEIVEIGELAAQDIDLPGIFVDRVVKSTTLFDVQALNAMPGGRRPLDNARDYNGKPGLPRQAISRNAAKLLKDDSYVNLGTGLPTQVSNFLEGRGVWLHAENGLLGYGAIVNGDRINPNVFNASGQFVEDLPGSSYFDSITSFEMARGGHVDAVVLGAYEVDQEGNLANWSTSGSSKGGIGGAMDLVAGDAEIIIVMEHCDSKGRPKLRRRSSYPLTGTKCVDWIVTDLATFHWLVDHFELVAVAPGFTAQEVIALTEMDNVTVASQLGVMA